MDTEERLRRLEFESLLLRENIWDITRRFALLENLVRSHVTGNQNVPAAPSATSPDSASVLDLYKRLSNLEFFVQNIQGGSDGTDSCEKSSKSEEPVAKGANFGGYKTMTSNFTVLQNIPPPRTPVDYGFGEATSSQRQQPQWGLFNPIKTQDQVNSMGRVVTSSAQVKSNPAIIDTPISKNNSGSIDNQIQPGTSSNVAPTLPAKPLANCTKLCGKYTGHVCGHIHGDTFPCPPCKFLMKGLKLKCGHQADFECHQKNNIADFKCRQCDMTNNSQDITKPPFLLVAKGVNTPTISSIVEPPPPTTTQNDKNDKVVEDESWMAVSWLDDDVGTKASEFPPISASKSTQQGLSTGQQTKPVQATATFSTATTAKKLTSSDGTVPVVPIKMSSPSVSSSVTTQMSLSSSSIRTNASSNAPSSFGSQNSIASIPGSPKISNVEVIFGNYMKVNGRNKSTRTDWIKNTFKDYTVAQLNTFLRSLSRYVVNLERSKAAGAGQLLAVMSESLTTKEAVIEAFLNGIISDLPKLQIDNKDNFEMVGFSVCYILVAMFNDEKDLGWVIKLGKNLSVTKPLLWGIISTEIMQQLKDRKKDNGLLLLYKKTSGAEKVPLLQHALAGVKLN